MMNAPIVDHNHAAVNQLAIISITLESTQMICDVITCTGDIDLIHHMNIDIMRWWSLLHYNHSARYFPELQNVTSRIIFNIYRDEWLDF